MQMHNLTTFAARSACLLVGVLAIGVGFCGTASSQDLSWAAEAFGDGFDGYARPRRGPAHAVPQDTFGSQAFPALLDGGPRPFIEPTAPEKLALDHGEEPGTIVIDTANRRLYLALAGGEAYVYPISVGREGFTWTGTEKVSRIAEWPDWYPPKEMRERDPRLPEKMLGGIRNPLGAVAMFLGNSLYRIHGTNDPKTIGLAASSGCFRMLNGHAVHLASIVEIGATVKVLPHLMALPASAAVIPERNPSRT